MNNKDFITLVTSAIDKLEAQGLTDFVSERMEHYWIPHLNEGVSFHKPVIEANMKAEQLRKQAKELDK